MNQSTPLKAWPDPVYRGRPGYSARHFRGLSPVDNPRTIALRIIDEQQRAIDADKRLDAALARDGELLRRLESESLDRRLLAMNAANASFDIVIAALQSVAGTAYGRSPAWKRDLREARAAKRRAEETRAA